MHLLTKQKEPERDKGSPLAAPRVAPEPHDAARGGRAKHRALSTLTLNAQPSTASHTPVRTVIVETRVHPRAQRWPKAQ